MSAPLVSVCLPNLNNRPYLEERIDTILAQTYRNWELVVSDNYSDDGAWQFFEALARTDPRVRIVQAPREGMYPNWNRCIERARGEYIYIATSDDTMDRECLVEMVAALERHPDCDIAHCPLKIIDGHGREGSRWWWSESAFALSSGPLVRQPHVRLAPLDGLLHLTGDSVYISITQLLIRRSLFDRVGTFSGRWGSVGDFNWDMRAGLVANTVHVPTTWGGWRVHAEQATAAVDLHSAEHSRKIEEMIDAAIERSVRSVAPQIARRLDRWAADASRMRAFERDVSARRSMSPVRRSAYLAQRALGGPGPAWRYIASRALGRSKVDGTLRSLASVMERPSLIPAAQDAPGAAAMAS